jgi:thiamine biosynthesis lipoprotein
MRLWQSPSQRIYKVQRVGTSASQQIGHWIRARAFSTALILLLAATLASSCAAEQLFTRVHPAMGTDFTLYIYAADATAADREAEHVFDIVDQLDALLSNYKPESELSRINNEAANHAVTTDPETFRFLEKSLAWSAWSNGAFDITVGRLMKAWGFFRSTGHVPSEAELARVRADTGWKHMVLDRGTRTVRFTARVELDPGGIGKGFAVDAAVKALRDDGVHAALFSAGSSTIYGLGAPPDAAGWKVRVPDPEHTGGAISTAVLRDTSLSTANCSKKHFIVRGHLYCHIMDPRTLRPVEGRLQATVIAPSATDSDALSNAMFVLGTAGRKRLMHSLPKSDSALVVLAGGVMEKYRWPASVK